SEELLASFHRRVTRLRASGEDVSAFVDPRVSGIAGTAFSAIWSYDIARYLAARYPSRVEIDWEGYEDEEQIVSVLKSFLPLFKRSEVSLDRELEDPLLLPLRKLSRADGERLVSLGRDMMTVRYRELHGFTYGDPQHVVRAAAGRGVEFVIWVARQSTVCLY